MSSRFTLICFDLDGTLIDSRRDIADSVNRMLVELKLPVKAESLIAAYVGNGVSNLIKNSLGDLGGGREKELFNRALKVFRKDYDLHCLDTTKLYPGVEENLGKIKGHKVVVTNKPLYYSEKILKGLSIRDSFDRVLGGDMEFPKKPAPDVVNHLAGHYGISSKDKILFVGDSILDIHTGKNAGVITCGVTYGFGKKDELIAAAPDYLINSFEEILGIL